MSRTTPSILASLALFAVVSVPAAGICADADTPMAMVESLSQLDGAEVDDGATMLAADDLADISGGQNTISSQALSNQELTATAAQNSVNVGGDYATGDISFSDNALGNFNGIGNFVINSGSNNILQGTIAVTIVSAPAI